jgi:hypothetical protein
VDVKFLLEFAGSKDLNASASTISQPALPQQRFVDLSAIVKLVQALQIDGDVPSRVPRVIEASLWNAPDQRHLPAFKSDTYGTARASRLAFATTSAGLTVATGLSLAEPFAAVLSSGSRSEIV